MNRRMLRGYNKEAEEKLEPTNAVYGYTTGGSIRAAFAAIRVVIRPVGPNVQYSFLFSFSFSLLYFTEKDNSVQRF